MSESASLCRGEALLRPYNVPQDGKIYQNFCSTFY